MKTERYWTTTQYTLNGERHVWQCYVAANNENEAQRIAEQVLHRFVPGAITADDRAQIDQFIMLDEYKRGLR